MKYRNFARSLAILALLLAPGALGAQQDTIPRDSLPAYRIEGVTVTRAPLQRDLVPQKVEVIGRAELDRIAAENVAEALKKTSGVDVIQYPGLLAGVSIRGFRPQFSGVTQRTLILIDGRPSGATNLATLGLTDVERIEVLKGPASALYGSSAMGGVVNVVSRRSLGAPGGRASVGYGSYGSYRGEVSYGGNLTSALDFDLTAAAYGRIADYEIGSRRILGGDSITKTFADQRTARLAEAGGDTVRPFSEYGVGSASARVGYALAPSWRLEGRATTFTAGEIQNPGDITAAYDSRTLNDLQRHTAELSARGSVDRHSLLVRGFANRELTQYYSQPERPYFVNFRTPVTSYGAQLQDDVQLGDHGLTAGVDYLILHLKSKVYTAPVFPDALYSPNSAISSAAAFAQGRFSFLDERLTATLGGRLDRVGSEVKAALLASGARVEPRSESYLSFNPSAGAQYQSGGARVHATVGRAFVTPDAFAIAGYSERGSGAGGVAIARGNPDLSPESSLSWDAGIGLLRRPIGLEADVTYFHTDVRDRITTRTAAPAGVELTAGGDTVRAVTSYLNADEGAIRGVEGQLSLDLGALRGAPYSLRLFANATRILRAEESSGGVTREVKNVADLTAGYGIDFDDGRRFSGRLAGRYVGERLDDDFSDFVNPGTVRYPSFMVVDLSADARVGGRYRIGAQVENLLDENYYEVRGYNLPGRTLLLRVGTTF